MNLLLRILFDEFGGTLAITRVTANTLITASATNNRAAEIEAVVNGSIEAGNIAADAVTAVKINVDVVRTSYGLAQHTDGSLYVDLSDTNPGLEVNADGGLRIIAYGLAQRTSNGLDIGRSGDLLLSSASSVPTGWSDVSATYEGKMIRISATALSTGGSDTHTHASGAATVTGSTGVHNGDGNNGYGTAAGGGPQYADHTHAKGTLAVSVAATASGDNVPSYVSAKMMKKD